MELGKHLSIWLALFDLEINDLGWVAGLSQAKLSNSYPVFVGVEYSP
jgi:hypothetical protein